MDDMDGAFRFTLIPNPQTLNPFFTPVPSSLVPRGRREEECPYGQTTNFPPIPNVDNRITDC